MNKLKSLFCILLMLCLSLFINVSFATTHHLKSYDFYMAKLVKIAKQDMKAPFAAMIVDKQTGEILATGFNPASNDPTAHGEIQAMRNALKKHPHIKWSDTILITTAEPCPMCESAIVWAGIPTVVYGTSIPYLEKEHWAQINMRARDIAKRSSFYKGKVIGGVLHKETDKLYTHNKSKLYTSRT